MVTEIQAFAAFIHPCDDSVNTNDILSETKKHTHTRARDTSHILTPISKLFHLFAHMSTFELTKHTAPHPNVNLNIPISTYSSESE